MPGRIWSPTSTRSWPTPQSVACSGAWPWPISTRQRRPPARISSPCGDPPEAERHRRHRVGEVERPRLGPRGQHRRRHARAAPERQRLGAGPRLHVERQHPRRQPGGAGRPERRARRLEPAGEPDVVRMVVGQDDPPDRPAAERPGHQRRPGAAHRRGVEAGVDQRPAVAVVERIGVEVVRPERQRQAHPEHAFGQRHGFTRAWRLGEGILDGLPPRQRSVHLRRGGRRPDYDECRCHQKGPARP